MIIVNKQIIKHRTKNRNLFFNILKTNMHMYPQSLYWRKWFNWNKVKVKVDFSLILSFIKISLLVSQHSTESGCKMFWSTSEINSLELPWESHSKLFGCQKSYRNALLSLPFSYSEIAWSRTELSNVSTVGYYLFFINIRNNV